MAIVENGDTEFLTAAKNMYMEFENLSNSRAKGLFSYLSSQMIKLLGGK